MRLACLRDDDRSSFLGDGVDSASNVEVGNLGEDTCVDNAQTSDTLYSEARIKDSVRVALRANGH